MTQTHIIEGKASALKLLEKLGHELKRYKFKPGLATILVGENPASQIYIKRKIATCTSLGIASFPHFLPETTSEKELINLIDTINRDDQIDGILIQLPLPPHLDTDKILTRVAPQKDVDGFHPLNVGKLTLGQDSLTPCTALGCLKLLKEITTDLSGLHAVIIGRSQIVGKPTALLLLQENCTVTVAHSHTKDLGELCKQADILIAAVGKPGLVKGSWIKPGSYVIDVGISRDEDRLKGDVNFGEALGKAAAITPVPGGVGPMTIACLMHNTLKAALQRRRA